MLTRTNGGEAGNESSRRHTGLGELLAVASGLLPAVILAAIVVGQAPQALSLKPEVPLAGLGQVLTGPYVLAFELISVVLVVAMAGAVLLGFERRKGQ